MPTLIRSLSFADSAVGPNWKSRSSIHAPGSSDGGMRFMKSGT